MKKSVAGGAAIVLRTRSGESIIDLRCPIRHLVRPPKVDF